VSPGVVVVTDSAASIPPELVDRYGIVVVPLTVVVGGQAHPDGELPLADVMARVADGVTTSGPSPGEFVQPVEDRIGAGAQVLILTISREMSSSTYKSAETAMRLMGDGAGRDGGVRLVDTGTAAGAQGLVVLAAAARAAAGAGIDEVEAAARRVVDRVRLVASVPNLDRLAQSGRVPGVAGMASRWLGLRPLFQFRHGHARPLRPAFSAEAAAERIVALCWGSAVKGAELHVAALHAEAADQAEALLAMVEREAEPVTAFVAPFSSVMVAHTGLGLVGLAWWWDERA
jgi:DegV family protein with EDD domain